MQSIMQVADCHSPYVIIGALKCDIFA